MMHLNGLFLIPNPPTPTHIKDSPASPAITVNKPWQDVLL